MTWRAPGHGDAHGCAGENAAVMDGAAPVGVETGVATVTVFAYTNALGPPVYGGLLRFWLRAPEPVHRQAGGTGQRQLASCGEGSVAAGRSCKEERLVNIGTTTIDSITLSNRSSPKPQAEPAPNRLHHKKIAIHPQPKQHGAACLRYSGYRQSIKRKKHSASPPTDTDCREPDIQSTLLHFFQTHATIHNAAGHYGAHRELGTYRMRRLAL